MSGTASGTSAQVKRAPSETRPARAAGRSAREAASPLEQVLSVAGLSIVEALNEGVIVQDSGGRVLAFNRRAPQILHVPADQLAVASPATPIAPFVHEDGSPLRAEELPTVASLRSGERISDVVIGLRPGGGAVRWMSVTSAPLFRDGETEPYAAVASFTDITDFRLRLREQDAARLKDVKRLALVAEYRDDDTNRHTERVAQATARMAMELGLDRELIWTIGRAAPLHDVGKVAIPDTILLKPGKLTPEEFEVMKSHTTIGGRILADSDFAVIQMGMQIALTHHERWDGSGYPAGLSGEEIPIAGRLLAVADAFDAMSHSRPYKEALPVPDAVNAIRSGSGTQFDPEIVAAFLALDHHSLVEDS
jgi:putative two-component system response regulator